MAQRVLPKHPHQSGQGSAPSSLALVGPRRTCLQPDDLRPQPSKSWKSSEARRTSRQHHPIAAAGAGGFCCKAGGCLDGVGSPLSQRIRKGRGPAGNTRKTRPAQRRATLPPTAKDWPRAGSGVVARPEASGTPLRIPFGNKKAAHKLGACYGLGGWSAPPGVALDPFRERGWM